MRKLLVLTLTVFSISSFGLQRTGDFGLGVILGSPTGLSSKLWLVPNVTAIDGAVAYSFTHGGSFHIHLDHLWHRMNVFQIDRRPIDLFYGIGGRIATSVANADKGGAKEARFGPRFPVGLRYQMYEPDIDFFVEMAMILDLIPGTYLDLNAGIGARYFF